MTVLILDGREVVIAPKPQLKSLAELVDRVAEGWQGAIYG